MPHKYNHPHLYRWLLLDENPRKIGNQVYVELPVEFEHYQLFSLMLFTRLGVPQEANHFLHELRSRISGVAKTGTISA
jgi:hypothetical protein